MEGVYMDVIEEPYLIMSATGNACVHSIWLTWLKMQTHIDLSQSSFLHELFT